MKKELKTDLAYECKTLKLNGFGNSKALDTLYKSFPEVSKSTVQKYWKIFSQEKQDSTKEVKEQ